MKRLLLSALMLGTPISTVASGILLPKDGTLPALSVKHQRVDVTIKDAVATARIEQVFRNTTGRDLEAVYVFPLPVDASIVDFAMTMNGKRVSGELVEKDKARKIYRDIVRRMRDPGLLEHLGGSLFRASVYPVPANGDQKIEICYSHTIAYDSGLYAYRYPLKTGEHASQTLEDFTVRVAIESSQPLKSIYSPSHKVGISRKDEYHAVIGFEEDASVLDRDFMLYYGISEKDFGLNLLTHRVKGEDGFFMLMIAPRVSPKKGELIARDVAFVVDTSGSMAGKKMEQARGALRHCVNRLNPGDRFTIVRFSTDVETMSDELLPVGPASRKKARVFIDGLEARGGTAIHPALIAAAGLCGDSGRPYTIIFLTDGKPTIGISDTDAIVKALEKAASEQVRLFAFGVGNDVNTHLLDRIADDRGGVSQYVRPEEDIEVKVSSFYDKASHPVLDRPAIVVEKVGARMLHPQALRDFFAGEQITVFGRYRGDGHVAIHLKGEVNENVREFVYEGTFPKASTQNDFIPRLWATRRVGYLLDQIRTNGEEKELKDEVVLLSTEYGIMTPYTSYLILESDEEYARRGIPRTAMQNPVTSAPPAAKLAESEGRERLWADRLVRPDAERRRSSQRATGGEIPLDTAAGARSMDGIPMLGRIAGQKGQAQADPAMMKRYFDDESGEHAVDLSEALDLYKEAKVDSLRIASSVRRAAGRVFYLIDGVWTDRDYREGMQVRTLVYADDAYFDYLEKHPELKSAFALGPRVILCFDEQHALIVGQIK